ncbi:ornithine cyclodeaminase family protein [Gulosibacter chungangensis]|uniref:Ornithine cyclodeaminase family protein n=2 Tax=Gulosibacter chungangensis TaxID=979746 RepID=A0A7J5BI35_9MICO|nr:ornithine cyclodeaminase family protein [Gulosibacter chungangensis]
MSPADAVAALQDALREGFDPATDHQRIADPLANGEFLIMPSETASAAGLKVLTVTPDNPARGLERIQGLFVLFDAETLTPTHLIDGAELTALRTPAVSFAATADRLLDATDPLRVVVYGAGPQAVGHVNTLRSITTHRREIDSVIAVVRSPEGVADPGPFQSILCSGSAEALEATAAANLIICTTTARSPLFDGALVRDDAVVIAVGSHVPDARELDGGLLGRANVVVESIDVALRECGDVVMAIAENALEARSLIPMREVVTGQVKLAADKPLVFKSAGMPWQDLVIAEAAARAFERS